MVHKSLAVRLPDTPPFDRADWFTTFLGQVVRPVVDTRRLERFWFSRYGGATGVREAKFRFSTEYFEAVHQLISGLIARLQLTLVPEHGHVYPHDFDVIGDLSHSRFVGSNLSPKHPVARGDLNYDFLHRGAVLTLDYLSGPEPSGYFGLEPENRSGYNAVTSMETMHHLFSNMCGVNLIFVLAEHPQHGQHWMTIQMFLHRTRANGEPWTELFRSPVLW
jgi:hypothetical protein